MDEKDALWQVAVDVARVRLGIAPQRSIDGVSLKDALKVLPPEDARLVKRKYRKLWRRGLARVLREFEKTPKRGRRGKYRWSGDRMRGRWKSAEDPLDAILIVVAACEVGSRSPSKNARLRRWEKVEYDAPFRKALLEAATELGLTKRRPRSPA